MIAMNIASTYTTLTLIFGLICRRAIAPLRHLIGTGYSAPGGEGIPAHAPRYVKFLVVRMATLARPARALPFGVSPGSMVSMRRAFLEWRVLPVGQSRRVRRGRRGVVAGGVAAVPGVAAVAAGISLVLAVASGAAGAVTVRITLGQNLTQVAAANGTTVAALAAANGISNPDQVLAGTLLVVPPGPPTPGGGATPGGGSAAGAPGSSTIVVAPGQNLTVLAARYGTTVAALARANGLTDPNFVVAGSHLVVPDPSAASRVSLPPSTALASYSAPAPGAPAGSSLPPQLLAYPSRVALRPLFAHWAGVFGIPPNLLEAMCWWESGWQVGVVSSTAALGIGQLEPATVASMRAQLHAPTLDPSVASDNIEMSAAFLHDLLVASGNDSSLALAGYYQGFNSVKHSGMYPSTAHYVKGILAYLPYFS
jgi:LysM repeat protein